jgi:hypothetical protein
MASSAISMIQAPQTAEDVFSSWLDQFNRALETLEPAGIGDCFIDDGYWKDFLAITWDFRTYSGNAEIRNDLVPVIAQSGIRALQAAQGRTLQEVGAVCARGIV